MLDRAVVKSGDGLDTEMTQKGGHVKEGTVAVGKARTKKNRDETEED